MPSRCRGAHGRLADLEGLRGSIRDPQRAAGRHEALFAIPIRCPSPCAPGRPPATPRDLETASHRDPALSANRFLSDEAGVHRHRYDADLQLDSHKTTQRRTCSSQARVAAGGGAEGVTSALRDRAREATHAPREAETASLPPFDVRSICAPRPAGRTRRLHGHGWTVAVCPDRGRAEASLSTSARGQRLRLDGLTPAELSRTGAAAKLGATDSRFRTGRCAPVVPDLSITPQLRTSKLQTRASGPSDWPSRSRTSASPLGCGPRRNRLAFPDREMWSRGCRLLHGGSAAHLGTTDTVLDLSNVGSPVADLRVIGTRFRPRGCGPAVADLSTARTAMPSSQYSQVPRHAHRCGLRARRPCQQNRDGPVPGSLCADVTSCGRRPMGPWSSR